jgi:acyl-CoA-binding protein
MHMLERYLTDCEGKRRRMRDRPSNAVLLELRALLRRQKESDAAHEAELTHNGVESASGPAAPEGSAPSGQEG